MLNRLFIVVGVLAILALLAAFIVPRFIQWGDYRERMEAIASEAVGAPVQILGDIEFSLLPAPKLRFTEAVVGPAETPVAMVAAVDAEFSLFDFLRDRYIVTKLVLDRPRFELNIDEAGAFVFGIEVAEEATVTNVAIEDAEIFGGLLRINDARSGQAFQVDGIEGVLQTSGLRGPFNFAGSGAYGDGSYSLRLASSAMGADGQTRLSAYVAPGDDSFSLTAEGSFTSSPAPHFTGELTFRQKPPTAGEADNVRGDLIVVSSAEFGTDQLLLPAYTIVPDENRAATRLTGAAVVELGAAPTFNAVVSGGVLALPPRDATQEEEVAPYELVRLLAELSAPAIPPLPGTIGVDIAEFDLRALAARNIRFDAVTDAQSWEITDFSAQLPGDTTLRLDGQVSTAAGRPAFSGTMSLDTKRLDALATLWRRPGENNPLLNLPATMSAYVALGTESLSFTNGSFVLDETEHAFAGDIGYGDGRRLDLRADLTTIDADAMAALEALVPDPRSDAAFALTFPRGKVSLTADGADVRGLAARDVTVAASWEGGVVEIERLAAADLGGVGVDAKLTAFGTFAKPEFFGSGAINITSADAPALTMLFDSLRTPEPMRLALARHLPANLALRLDAPAGDGSQALNATGQAGVASLTADAILGGGISKPFGGAFGLKLDLNSPDPDALSAQLGLGDVSAFQATGPLHAVVALNGNPANSLETAVTIEGGGDTLSFAGNLVVTNPGRWSGSGILRASLSDPTPLLQPAGLDGLHVPAISGSASIDFAGFDTISLEEIEARGAGQRAVGYLRLRNNTVSGELSVASVEVGALLAALAGPAALISSATTLWPDGPVAVGNEPRSVRGRVRVTTPQIASGETTLVSNATFDLDWDATRIQLKALSGTIANGRLTADFGLCCAGDLPEKQLTGRVRLEGADLDGILPPQLADALGGTIDLGAQFNGNGDSAAAIIGSLAGEGNFAVGGFSIERFDPATFSAIAGLDDILDLDPDAFATLVAQALERAPFSARAVSGGFTIAGGVVRSANLGVEAPGVRLFGGGELRLADLSLQGAYTLTPTGPVDAEGLINETTSRVTAAIGGTVMEPERTLDLTSMIDGIKVRAYELELVELERLRAEDDARRIAAEAETARYNAQQRAYWRAREVNQIVAESAAQFVGQGDDWYGALADAANAAADAAGLTGAGIQPLVGAPLDLTPVEPISQF